MDDTIVNNKNAIDLINTEHVQRITLNDDSALEIESVTGEFITNTVITIPTLDNITTIEERLSVTDGAISNHKDAIDAINAEYGRLWNVENTLAKILSSYAPRFTAIEERLSALEDS